MAEQPQKIGFSIVYQTSADWQEVNDAIKDAIAEEGVVISYTSHASDMLNRTAISLDIEQNTYKQAQIHLFCKVDLSHKMIALNPHVIAGCPYGIAVYELKQQPGVAYVSYRQPPSNDVEPAYEGVQALIVSIIETALDY